MKRILLMGGIFCALVMVTANAADTSFAGTWTLDKAKSENLGTRGGTGEQTWTVTQDEKTLTVETKIVTDAGDRTQKSVFNLDGSETTADVSRGQMTGKGTTKAKWSDDKKTLETTHVFKGKRGDNDVTMTTTDKWELADEGKTIKIARKREGGPNAAQESKLVLAKK